MNTTNMTTTTNTTEKTTSTTANRAAVDRRRAQTLHRRGVAKQKQTFDEDALRAKLMHRFHGNTERTEKVLERRRAAFERRQRKAKANANANATAATQEKQSAPEESSTPASDAVTTAPIMTNEQKLHQILMIKFDGDEAKVARVMSRRMSRKAKKKIENDTTSQPEDVKEKEAPRAKANFEERMAAREEKLRAILMVQLDGNVEKIDRIMAKRKANIAARIARRKAASNTTDSTPESENETSTTEEVENVPQRSGRRIFIRMHPKGHAHGRRAHHHGRRGHHHGRRPHHNGIHCHSHNVEAAEQAPTVTSPAQPTVTESNTNASNNVAVMAPAHAGRRAGHGKHAKKRGHRHGRHMSHFHAHHLPRHQRHTMATQEAPAMLA